MIVKQ